MNKMKNKKERRYFHKKVVRHMFKFRYPKIELLILSVLIAYAIFKFTNISESISRLGNYRYLGAFISGILYSFGFSAAFAVAFFTTITGLNIFIASVLGGLGALLTDMTIFTIIKSSFMDEFNRIRKTKPFLLIERLMEKDLNSRTRRVLLYCIVGFVIGSPLPAEIGVTMLSGLTNIKPKAMVIVSIIFNTLGIFVILWLGRKFVWGF